MINPLVKIIFSLSVSPEDLELFNNVLAQRNIDNKFKMITVKYVNKSITGPDDAFNPRYYLSINVTQDQLFLLKLNGFEQPLEYSSIQEYMINIYIKEGFNATCIEIADKNALH